MTNLDQDTQFAAALAECTDRVRHGEAIEQCLADYPAEYRDELARLAPSAMRLEGLRRDPSPAFQARLEQRLLTDGAWKRRSVGWPAWLVTLFQTPSLAQLAGIALAVMLILGGGGAGAVWAAEDSLPDSPLYQVKTLREAVQLMLARSDEDRVGVRAVQIVKRGRELEMAVRAQKGPRVVALLSLRLADAIDAMVDRALALRARGQREPSTRALILVEGVQRRVERLSEQASPEVHPPLQRLQTFLDQQERRLRAAQSR